MRAAHNNAHARNGQSGAGFLPHLPVVHVVERRVGREQNHVGVWVDVWVVEGPPHDCNEFAGQYADEWRRRGFTVRVRPVRL